MIGWVITFLLVRHALRNQNRKYKVTIMSSCAVIVWGGLSIVQSIIKTSRELPSEPVTFNSIALLGFVLFTIITIGASYLYDIKRIKKSAAIIILILCIIGFPLLTTLSKPPYLESIFNYNWTGFLINTIIPFAAFCIVPILYRFFVIKKPIQEPLQALFICAIWVIVVLFILYNIPLFRLDFKLAILCGVLIFLLMISGRDRSTKKENLPLLQELNDNTVEKTPPSLDTKNDSNQKKEVKIGSFTITKQSSKKPKSKLAIILSIICIVLITGLGYLYNQNQHLKTSLNDMEATYDDLSSRYSKVTKYKGIAEFYLDNAVIIKDGDKHYHRMDCPKLGSEYSYQIHNIEAAKGNGYKKCPYCFGLGADEYADKELGSYAFDAAMDDLIKQK
ncbi:hypothetical protein NE619_15415 [Anaerovorax odorimutans]|uniref:Uncharacterized protein n=1 Tax=Anaerovorax odorimutans TaxID=109327 RepID=A0ABT1RSI3_9FIRM|nr:hypothetical protein [Anaerovorax odorimutans]MCQ4638125.1 hypothetical protein [Anaerovorax odorimutans]